VTPMFSAVLESVVLNSGVTVVGGGRRIAGGAPGTTPLMNWKGPSRMGMEAW